MASKKESADLILHKIHKEVRATNARLDETNARLDARIDETNVRIDGTNSRIDELKEHITRSEMRLATEMVAVAGTVGKVHDLLLSDRKRLDNCEQRITVLEVKVG